MSTKYNVREMRLVVIDTDEYIDADEAARILGIKHSGMSQLCREGRFSRMVRLGFWAVLKVSVLMNILMLMRRRGF